MKTKTKTVKNRSTMMMEMEMKMKMKIKARSSFPIYSTIHQHARAIDNRTSQNADSDSGSDSVFSLPLLQLLESASSPSLSDEAQ
jgi:hypothetical protein